ncbi:hypothetical protein, partial [Proteus mirabilis]|uniref:hypothetical protein n=1 Tax=Proteus mirabilis TaxID=584 RepID=UPI001C13035C
HTPTSYSLFQGYGSYFYGIGEWAPMNTQEQLLLSLAHLGFEVWEEMRAAKIMISFLNEFKFDKGERKKKHSGSTNLCSPLFGNNQFLFKIEN